MSEAHLSVFDPYWWALLTSIISISLSLIMHTSILWKYRVFTSVVNTIFIGASTGLMLVSFNPLFAVIATIVQTFRLITELRIAKNRHQEKSLFSKSIRSEVWLGAWLIGVILIERIFNEITPTIALILVLIQLIVVSVLYRHTLAMRRSTHLDLPKKFSAETDLPSLTIAIPARNQTFDLIECLHSVLRSTYPKLEILVLDDCSQDKTSDIIRKYAHRGVRFLEGTPPTKSWIAKNHAYDQLLDNASGELILFCGTDVRFEPQSFRLLIETFISNQYSMMSVLPTRLVSYDRHFLLQPMRYYRELVLPTKDPPAISSCWIAKRKMLLKHGGFEALRKSIRPERIIARGVNSQGNYSFVSASSGLGIKSQKDLRAQWMTAVRTRYPELKNRPESVLFSLIWQLFILSGPFISLLYGLRTAEILIIFLSVISIMYLFAVHLLVSWIATGKPRLHTLLLYPLSIILEISVTVYSMIAYEFMDVIWRGRNVCLPVIQSNLRLPRLP